MNRMILYILPAENMGDPQYNPTDLKGFNIELGSEIAEMLLATSPSVILIEPKGNGAYEIIRRESWPPSQESFNKLLHEGNGDGTGTAKQTFILKGEDDVFSPGVSPIGRDKKGWLLLIALLIGGYIILQE